VVRAVVRRPDRPVVVSASGDGTRLRGDGLIGRWDPFSGTPIGEPIGEPLGEAVETGRW
jgi:hypothetical protein